MDRCFVEEHALEIVLHGCRTIQCSRVRAKRKLAEDCGVRRQSLAWPMAMRVHSHQFTVRTRGKGTYEITDQVREIVDRSDVTAGTATVFVRHTSCSLVI